MQKLFYSIGQLPILKRKAYQTTRIFWNARPWPEGDRMYSLFSQLFPKYSYRHISDNDYAIFLRKSKSVINSLSPGGLVGPRYFESMASGALVLTDESTPPTSLIPNNLLVTFKYDLSDFHQILTEISRGSDRLCEIRELALEHCLRNHTWETRIASILREIETLLSQP